MSSGEDRGIIDQSSLRMREATFAAGIWLTYVVCGSGALYVSITWTQANRTLILALFAAGIAGAALRHSGDGAELVARVEGLAAIVPWIRHSHERFDGTGYPDGLRGKAIPQASRIMLVADAFDAITSSRPYRDAMGVPYACEELERHAGTQFDPDCVRALIVHLGAQPVRGAWPQAVA